MPIKGIVSAIAPEQRIENLSLGEEAYLDAFSLTVTERAIFIDRAAFVILKKHLDENEENLFDDHILVKRIGKGLTEHDFELDMTVIPEYDFTLDDSATYVDLMRHKDNHIIFYDFELEKLTNFRSKETEPAEENLEEQLREAVEKQDFEKATILREKIKNNSKK
ncbi:MAG TPA: UvrB/UvrC motif-containing protein [Candidatus Paceibacterota bacterium]